MIDIYYQVDKRGVPILKDSRIDEDVECLLQDYDSTLLTDPHAIDVDDFAERYMGYNLHYESLSNNGCIWGRMVFNDRRILVYDPETDGIAYHPVDANTIVVDNSLLDEAHEPAYRSTVAHEAAHGLYHPQIYKVDDAQLTLFPMNTDKWAVTACRAVDIAGSETKGQRRLSTVHDWAEHHAKYFSAALLMPKKAMHIVCSDEKTRKHYGQFGMMGDQLLAYEVARTFNVSVTSALIRISQLGYSFRKDEMQQQTIFTIGFPSRMLIEK